MKSGFYWVKIHDEWTIGEYTADHPIKTMCWCFLNIREGCEDDVANTEGFMVGKKIKR